MTTAEKNGSWKSWIIGIVAIIIATGVAGHVAWMTAVAANQASMGTELKSLNRSNDRIAANTKQLADQAAKVAVIENVLARMEERGKRIEEKIDELERIVRRP